MLRWMLQFLLVVFDGLDEKWRFAAVDADGSANGFDIRVYPRGGDEHCLFAYESDYANSDDNSVHIGTGYDATDWQNSLIERESKELTGSDLCRHLKSRKHWVLAVVSNEGDATAEFHQKAVFVTDIASDGSFVCGDTVWQYAVPINHKGEPLTASEVGL